MDPVKRLKRLEYSVQVFWALLIVGTIWFGISAVFRSMNESIKTLKLGRIGNEVHMGASSDGPFVVFGVATGYVEDGEKAYATFDPPVIITDSNGWDGIFSDLKWVNKRGEPGRAPKPEDELIPLYIRPVEVERRPRND